GSSATSCRRRQQPHSGSNISATRGSSSSRWRSGRSSRSISPVCWCSSAIRVEHMVVTEDVPCELCGSAQRTLLYWGVDRLLKHSGRFPLVRCDVCGLVYQSPRPLDIAPYYEGTYVSFDSQPSAWKPLLRRHAEQHTVFYGSAGLYYGLLRKV